ncbi:MAG: hypothetical protein XD41_1893 [Desulfonauticus sp. 38_4375]|nr:MAG: hypothetical protein XD41_1893 [Desulfonauticus sp. 38_4375]
MGNFSRQLCIYHALEGLREGLSDYIHPSRVALIYALTPEEENLRIYDPYDLLRGHEPILEELFLKKKIWLQTEAQKLSHLRELVKFENLKLSGLISFGGWSNSLYYQKWFTEHHFDLCSTGPIERWLEQATRLLAQDFALESSLTLGNTALVLEGLGLHAIRDYIVDKRNELLGLDTHLRIYPLLKSILELSKTKEEGAWARGKLAFVEPSLLNTLDFEISFPQEEQPSLHNIKHVRKLLTAVQHTEMKMISDGEKIVGISKSPLPKSSLKADFRGSHGFLYLDEELICSFQDGVFRGSNREPNLVVLEELLLETDLSEEQRNNLLKVVTSLVKASQSHKHGCSLILDLNEPPLEDIAGQNLERPLNLLYLPHLRLAKSLARVDGALHLTRDATLKKFACLLDGARVSGEDRSRGARFNSALRFTARREKVILIVVSADRPVSVIQNGVELTARCFWSGSCFCEHPSLKEWLQKG